VAGGPAENWFPLVKFIQQANVNSQLGGDFLVVFTQADQIVILNQVKSMFHQEFKPVAADRLGGILCFSTLPLHSTVTSIQFCQKSPVRVL
jgi:hypothetical protein